MDSILTNLTSVAQITFLATLGKFLGNFAKWIWPPGPHSLVKLSKLFFCFWKKRQYFPVKRWGLYVEGRRVVGWLDFSTNLQLPIWQDRALCKYQRRVAERWLWGKDMRIGQNECDQNYWNYPPDQIIDLKIYRTGFAPSWYNPHPRPYTMHMQHFFPFSGNCLRGIMVVTDYHTDSGTIIQRSFQSSEKCHISGLGLLLWNNHSKKFSIIRKVPHISGLEYRQTFPVSFY